MTELTLDYLWRPAGRLELQQRKVGGYAQRRPRAKVFRFLSSAAQ